MNNFAWFVLPFSIGLAFLCFILLIKYSRWIKQLHQVDKNKIRKNVFTHKSIKAFKEIFWECLIHRKIFKTNWKLGYMHASLAMGWFLLIVIGNFESRLFNHGEMSAPYVPIFFRYFNPNPVQFRYHNTFAIAMDLLLTLVLTGVIIAWIKRFYSRLVGLKKTTKLQIGDKLALYTLWLIFPLRFAAESITSASFGGGSFLTGNMGELLKNYLNTSFLVLPIWWAYSLALGIFFIALPYSRYMHIPTEVVLIFLRKYGIREKDIHTSFTKAEVYSCSRCGICIDTCQLASVAEIKGVQSVYMLKNLRNNVVNKNQELNCLMCGRCDTVCPVGIDIQKIRTNNRVETKKHVTQPLYNFLSVDNMQSSKVIYFAGCMSHQTPSIKKAMEKIFNAADVNYLFLDKFQTICCGRPLQLAGKKTEAALLKEKNTQLLESANAEILVTSCPICYKTFKEDYTLNLRVMHHSEYLQLLIHSKKIILKKKPVPVAYHDPCELGRKSGIYEQPRDVIKHVAVLQKNEHTHDKSLCCGGSLANFKIDHHSRQKIATETVKNLTLNNPEILVTACPLCKKTLQQATQTNVVDLVEIVANSLVTIKPGNTLESNIEVKKETLVDVEL